MWGSIYSTIGNTCRQSQRNGCRGQPFCIVMIPGCIYSYYLSYYRKLVVGWGWGKGMRNTRVSALTFFLSRQVWLLWIPASLFRFRPLFFIVFCGFDHFSFFTCLFCVFSSPPMSPNGPKSSQNIVGSFKIEVLRTFCFFTFKIVLGFLWEPSGH